MSKNLNEAGPCPNCGKPLPKGALAGLCPACLLANGDETQSRDPNPSLPFHPPDLERLSRLFPQLEILGLLGMGGMGAVYQARQPALDRLVALKLLPAGGGVEGGNFSERFNREARALARLNHPNIVAVHEFGQVQGQPFFIMEFVDGANLRQLERAGRLSPREVLQIIPQICDALQYAHDEGVVHRDIKPENVLLDRKGRVKIADFGLAKILERNPEALRLTAEGQVMGTPHYMAPEQVERPLAVDHRADIYSLGVVFYEMLTGDLPIGKFAPPSRKVQLDVRLDEVVLRALENDPERRYQQAGEVKRGVAHATSGSHAANAAEDRTEPEDRSNSSVRKLRWLGIPVVVERNGEREVSFNGALGAVAAILPFVGLGFLLVRWFTQGEHVSPLLCFWAGLLTVAWGVRRTLHRVEPATPSERTPQGTLILNAPRRFRFKAEYLAPVALVAFVVGLHFLLADVIGPWLQSRQGPALAEQTAVLDRQSRTLAASLPGHGRIELLALAHRGATPKQWWRPDGSLPTNTGYELRSPAENSQSGRVSKDAVFRISGFGRDVEGPLFEAEPSSGCASGGMVYLNGQRVPGLLQARFAWPPQTRAATIYAGFAVDSWRTVHTQDARGNNITTEILPDDPRWEFHVHGVSEVTEGAQITIVMGRDHRDWRTRLVALDTNDVVHTHHRAAGTPQGDATIWTYTFPGLPLAQVKAFRVDVRRVRWVEFRDVALEPDNPVPLPEPLRFGDTMERTFDELIDFDTGRTTNYPLRVSAGQLFDSLADGFLWAQAHGYDAEATLGKLNVLQMNFGMLSNEDWDNGDPQSIMDKHYRSTFRPYKLGPLNDGKLPVTYSFETRDGTLGVLQLVALDPDRPGATVRFKHLLR